MKRTTDRRLWGWRLVALAAGGAAFGLAASNGQALEMLWLPAVILGAIWPYGSKGTLRSCLRTLRREGEERV
jgi:hypothetical protein